jgi:hypothetical protein
MSSRKIAPGNGPTGHQSLAPRMAVKIPVVTAEYTEALRVLNDETMSQACALLLSERDYEEPAGKSDHEELLALYAKCRNAAAVIKREAPAELHSVPTMPAPARAQAKALGKVTVAAKNMIVPSRRMARLPPPAKGKRPQLHHENSDSSMEAQRASNTKKARLSPPPHPREGSAPPPSALNFLAKLNKEKDKSFVTEKKEVKEKEVKEKTKEKTDVKEVKEKTEVKEKKETVEKEQVVREKREVKEKKEIVAEKVVVKGRIQPPRASRR